MTDPDTIVIKRWRDHAACAGVDLDDVNPALCRTTCGVVEDCLRAALHEEQHLPASNDLYYFLTRGGEMAPRRRRAMQLAERDPEAAFTILREQRLEIAERNRRSRLASERRRQRRRREATRAAREAAADGS